MTDELKAAIAAFNAAPGAPVEQPETVDIIMADGLFAKQTHVKRAGTVLPQHSHVWDHASFISHGAARVWKDALLIGDFQAPHGLMIEAHTKHTFMTLADNTVISCIHRIDRTGEIEIEAEHQIKESV